MPRRRNVQPNLLDKAAAIQTNPKAKAKATASKAQEGAAKPMAKAAAIQTQPKAKAKATASKAQAKAQPIALKAKPPISPELVFASHSLKATTATSQSYIQGRVNGELKLVVAISSGQSDAHSQMIKTLLNQLKQLGNFTKSHAVALRNELLN